MLTMLTAREKLRLIQGGKSLRQLIQACPDLWQETGTAINTRLGGLGSGRNQKNNSNALNEYLQELTAKADGWIVPLRNSGWNLGMAERAFPDLMRARLAKLAMHNYYLGSLAGKTGKIRFNWWNGSLLQRLLFRGGGFARKPVSLFWYGLMWPLISQKKILMRLVYQKGIYCFYSRRLIKEIKSLIGAEFRFSAETPSALEIAAGDGTLSRFLRNRGIEISACDDFSWDATAQVAPADVQKMDAITAIKTQKPKVIICSWPPAGNAFEQAVFASPATELYIVIGSMHHFASGNRAAYAAAVGSADRPGPFVVTVNNALARAILPRELDIEVLIFRRRPVGMTAG